MHIPTIIDRNNPKYWYSRHPIKWHDEYGQKHKTYVTPIKYLATGHLSNILIKYTIKPPEKTDSILIEQIKNVQLEYRQRRTKHKTNEENLL